jgi:hypothetical protein
MNITDVLERGNIPFKRDGEHHHAHHGWVQVDCPWCGRNSGKFHLGIALGNYRCSCWRCGAHRLIDVLTELTGADHKTCRAVINGLEVRFADVWPKPRTGTLQLPKGVGHLLPIHEQYLRNRGFDPVELAERWHLQGIGGTGEPCSWSIFIPIEFHGSVVSWTTRKINEKAHRRYYTAQPEQEHVAANGLLFGEDLCRHGAIVTEGPFDAMRIGPGATATMGTHVSQAQVNRISRYSRRIICFDAEPEAQKRAKQLCNALCVFPGLTHNVVLDSKDAADADSRELRQLRELLI